MNKAQADAISKDIIAALKEVEAKHGIKITDKGGRFGDDYLDMKIQITENKADGSTNHFAKEARDFEMYQNVIGLKGYLNKKVKVGGKPYIIVGYKSKARKNTILIQNPKDFGKTRKAYVVNHNAIIEENNIKA